MNSEEIRSEGHRALLVVVCDVEENYSVSCVLYFTVCLCRSYGGVSMPVLCLCLRL